MVDGVPDSPPWLLPGLAAGQSVALLWYRRFPLSVLVVVTGIEVTLVARDMELLVGFAVAASGLGAWGKRLQQRVGLALGLGLLLLGLGVSVNDGTPPSAPALAITAVAVVFLGFWATGRLGARRRDRIRRLDAYSRRLAAERAVAVRRAAEEERILLARDLHDILNHSLTAMVLDADAVAETGDDAETRLTLRRVAGTGREALAEMRRLVAVLRTSGTADGLLAPPGLDRLDELARLMPDGGPRVRLERHGPVRPVEASIERVVYRVVQESLTNVRKHARSAGEVVVSLGYEPDRLCVRVANSPPVRAEPPATGGGLGLIGMRERVELMGGSLESLSGPDGGFEVRALLPLRSRG
jgi:signal transduction histidine kinase